MAGKSEGDEPEDRLTEIPGFAAGGLVERTGIALVHEGEYVIPAPGSEAVIGALPAGDSSPTVNFYFPVEVEVVGEPTEQQKRAIAQHVYDELMREFAKRAP